LYVIPQADTNAYFIGDVVRSAAGGNLFTGVSAVTLVGTRNAATTTGAVRGVIVGLGAQNSSSGVPNAQLFDTDNLNVLSIPATKTKDYYVWVADSPTVLFEAQVDSLIAANFNKNAPLFVGLAPTAPRVESLSYAQGSAAAVTATLPLRLLGEVNRIDNEIGQPFAKALVMFNQHELAANTVGV
jgi:hypothetical protein